MGRAIRLNGTVFTLQKLCPVQPVWRNDRLAALRRLFRLVGDRLLCLSGGTVTILLSRSFFLYALVMPISVCLSLHYTFNYTSMAVGSNIALP